MLHVVPHRTAYFALRIFFAYSTCHPDLRTRIINKTIKRIQTSNNCYTLTQAKKRFLQMRSSVRFAVSGHVTCRGSPVSSPPTPETRVAFMDARP